MDSIPNPRVYLLNQAGYYLSGRAEYVEAEPLYRRALAIRENALGPDHPSTATSLNNLALLYRKQGRYEQVEPLYRRALAIYEKALGPDHPSTATSLNNLALLYRKQGRYEEAEPLYRRALIIREKALGPDHPGTATSLDNLAALYYAKAGTRRQSRSTSAPSPSARTRWGSTTPTPRRASTTWRSSIATKAATRQAEPLYQRALAIHERALGPDHPATATSLNNLAALFDDQGRYEQAEPLYQRALAIREKVLGPDHPDTAASLNNLALFYKSQDRYEQAEPLYQRALAICEKVLGPDHPHTARVTFSYACFLRKWDGMRKLWRFWRGPRRQKRSRSQPG